MKKYLHGFILTLSIGIVPFILPAQSENTAPSSPFVELKGALQGAQVTLQYSAPSVKGRTIWDGLVPYGKVWRTGANEATTFETDRDIVIQGQPLPAGKYALFTIPGESEWIWIFNAVWDQWGAYKYEASNDVLRVSVSPEKSSVSHEQMKFELDQDTVTLYWENIAVSFK